MKIRSLLLLISIAGLSACSSLNPFSSSTALKPTPLAEFTPKFSPSTAWKVNIGKSSKGSFVPALEGDLIYAASETGTIMALKSATGEVVWQKKTDSKLIAGVGVTADTVAVIDENYRLVSLDQSGNTKWTISLDNDVSTPPLGVAGLIIVRTIDYAVSAYSAENGGLVWRYQRQLPPLTLRSDTQVSVNNGRVYAGFPGGKLVGLDVNNGSLTWEGTLSSPSGTTEIERITDVTGTPVYNFREVCAASFQGKVGCLDALTGRTLWSQPFSSPEGASVDERYVIAADESGELFAFSRSGGKEVWRNPALVRRQPGSPVVTGRAVAVADFEGYVHFLDRDNGNTISRLKVSGEPLTGEPIMVGGSSMLVQARSGELIKVLVQ